MNVIHQGEGQDFISQMNYPEKVVFYYWWTGNSWREKEFVNDYTVAIWRIKPRTP